MTAHVHTCGPPYGERGESPGQPCEGCSAGPRGTFDAPRREVEIAPATDEANERLYDEFTRQAQIYRNAAPVERDGWAVYFAGDDMAIVNMPHRIAMQIAKQFTHATVITTHAAARVKHQHQLRQTVCAQCAGKDGNS